MKIEVRLAGFGGQGIILSGVILGRAAAIHDGRYAIQTQSYGPEARGGASKSEVIISDEEIHYPKVKNPDVFMVMSPEAFEKYVPDLAEDGTIIYDSSLIKEMPERYKKAYPVPATLMAKEELGKVIVANIIMLGAVSAITGCVSREAIKKAVLESVPKGTEELNTKALEMGFEAGEKLKGEKR
jgi:2-oxoglutarate ferredoxin oxidoreductase subunit gamma